MMNKEIHHSSFIIHHSPTGIPTSLRPCFQEYDFEQLNPAQHADLIIERTLAYGNRAELRWLFSQYGRPRLVEWVRSLGARRLPWRRYNLWCVLLGLPPARRLRPEGTRIWPY
jgi:hypothetical protein